jgi:putative DNA primase/helicase
MDAEPARFELVAPEAGLSLELATVLDAPPIAEAAGGDAAPFPADAPPDGHALPLPAEASAGCAHNRLRPLRLAELFALPIKPREMVLDPIIPEKGLAMLYAARGTGKTHVALGIAYAVATGSTFLKWRAERPRRVLLIDGEMPAQALRERLARVVAAPPSLQLRRTETEPVEALAETGAERETPAPALLDIIAGDLIERGIGNLASPPVQAELEPWLEGVELLILDNLSSLTAALRENDGDAWSPLQQWLLRLRRRGISVLIVHHAGKGGEQRGTSRREDVLDTSISLRRPDDYAPTEGARFTVHIEKGRGIHGEHARPFEASLAIVHGRALWSMKEVEDAGCARVASLLTAGLSIREIAEETGIHRSKVHRLKRRIEEEQAEAEEVGTAEAGAGARSTEL